MSIRDNLVNITNRFIMEMTDELDKNNIEPKDYILYSLECCAAACVSNLIKLSTIINGNELDQYRQLLIYSIDTIIKSSEQTFSHLNKSEYEGSSRH